MASYLHVKFLGLVEDKDNDGNFRIRARIREITPREHLVNLKDDVNVINKLRSMPTNSNMMLPSKQTMMNGQLYVTFDGSDAILPMPPDAQSSTASPASASSVQQPAKS